MHKTLDGAFRRQRIDFRSTAGDASAMHFVPGMTCCKPARVELGLECSVADMTLCAVHACQSCDADRLTSLFCKLVEVFPPAHVVQIARATARLDAALLPLAAQCAALSTRTARRGYVASVESVMSKQEHDNFLALHAAEWARLRGIETRELQSGSDEKTNRAG
ncbi:MAG: hypothetical protein WDN30_07710 [Pararobbsia sp.]